MATNSTLITPAFSTDDVLADPAVQEAVRRKIIEVKNGKVTYGLAVKKSYSWTDPEEWVRCLAVCRLVVDKDYPPNRMKTEVAVPRRTPNDFADVVVYRDDACKTPYLVLEFKSAGQSEGGRAQGIEQAFGNANSLRAPFTCYDEGTDSRFFDVAGYPPLEREANLRGGFADVPRAYGDVSEYAFVAGGANDISEVRTSVLESRIRRAHSLIWSGGKRDPLIAFDEWSKLLFAKVIDERTTRTGQPRRFQVGSRETTAAVANRIHQLFAEAVRIDPSIFPEDIRINLPDKKVFEIVMVLQPVSFTRSDVDSIGAAFENFFGSVFRGELGQYFTMRQIARFSVAMLGIGQDDYVIDPTAGSGGFLLEVLLQVWHSIDRDYAGQPVDQIARIKNDFALHKVFGIEIHEVLARICKINLLLHHDGHTNIEGDRSCLDSVFAKPRLNPPRERFTRVVGNPPFGDEVLEGDEDHLGQNHLSSFTVAAGRRGVASEHVIIERCVELLEHGGSFGLVIPDGVLNNQGELSNCPRVRRYLARNGVFEAIVSLPDYAFRKAGAQNKTSALFFRKFTDAERVRFERAFVVEYELSEDEDTAIAAGLSALNYKVFLAEANSVGYTSTGNLSDRNDLYRGGAGGQLEAVQAGTILGEYREFRANRASYVGRQSPDCMSISAADLWKAHPSHRLDPKYFLFKREERTLAPEGWLRLTIGEVMRRQERLVLPERDPERRVAVMTISQTGEIRPREAGKGRNPPEWLGMYFEDSPSIWYSAQAGDVVFSSIDLWKGCISLVPPEFDGALVTREFPIYSVTDTRLHPAFLWCLLRSRYYQRAFRAITTGHSNRRRTQVGDFEALEIAFPADLGLQQDMVRELMAARAGLHQAGSALKMAMLRFSDLIDGRGIEELPEVETEISDEDPV